MHPVESLAMRCLWGWPLSHYAAVISKNDMLATSLCHEFLPAVAGFPGNSELVTPRGPGTLG
jgi:hypothetical protein